MWGTRSAERAALLIDQRTFWTVENRAFGTRLKLWLPTKSRERSKVVVNYTGFRIVVWCGQTVIVIELSGSVHCEAPKNI